MTDFRGNVIHSHLTAIAPTLVINSMSSTTLDASDLTDDYNSARVLESHVNVCISDLTYNSNTGTIKSKVGRPVDHLTLANRWNIPVNRAKQTVTQTTQRGVKNCLTPSLSRRFTNNERMLRYNSLPHAFFSDTLIAGSVSKRGNKYAQMYGAYFGWSRDFPLEKKGDTHETLSLLFKRDGVPPEMIVDGAKENISSKFNKKLKEANCHLRQTEPYSPWYNAAEGTIHETKKGSSRKIIRTRYPKKWLPPPYP